MRGLISQIIIVFLTGLFKVAAAQLPREIMVDKYLIEAEQLYIKKDYGGALKMMEAINALQSKYGFKPPDEFHFKHARVALSADSIKIAFDSVNRYLSLTGTEGEYYKEALALLIETESPKISPDELCTGKPDGEQCWKELASHPNCYFWDDHYFAEQTGTWSGKCYHGVVHGQGTLTWAMGESRFTESGHIHMGKKRGKWVLRFLDGGISIGSYVDGKRHGLWYRRETNYDMKGEYIEGKSEGIWLRRFHGIRAAGQRCESITFRQGFIVGTRFVRGDMCTW